MPQMLEYWNTVAVVYIKQIILLTIIHNRELNYETIKHEEAQ